MRKGQQKDQPKKKKPNTKTRNQKVPQRLSVTQCVQNPILRIIFTFNRVAKYRKKKKNTNGSTFGYKCLMNHLPARIPLHAEVRINLQHSTVRYLLRAVCHFQRNGQGSYIIGHATCIRVKFRRSSIVNYITLAHGEIFPKFLFSPTKNKTLRSFSFLIVTLIIKLMMFI